MRCLVWINIRVFDDDFAIVARISMQTATANNRRSIEKKVDVARACRLYPLYTVNLANANDQFLRYGSGRTLQRAGELKCNRCGQFTEIDLAVSEVLGDLRG